MTVLGQMIMEDGIKIEEARGETRGIRIGRKAGEDRINRLNAVLLETDRIDDLKRATGDKEYREKLIRELFPEEEAEPSVEGK